MSGYSPYPQLFSIPYRSPFRPPYRSPSRPPWEIPLPSPLGDPSPVPLGRSPSRPPFDPPSVPLLIPLPSPFKRGRPKDASLLVPWGRPDVAGVFCSMGEARGCGSFLFHGGKRAKRSPEGGYKAQTLTNLAC